MAAPVDDGTAFSPLTQPITILAQDGITPVSIKADEVAAIYRSATSSSINYGSQIGATFLMLLVLLAMTARYRFLKAPAMISVLSLTINLVRVVLLSLFYPSHFMEFYTLVSGDTTFVPPSDYRISVTASLLSIPITILIELALVVQAWSMLRLWPTLWKAIVCGISAVIISLTVGFSFANSIMQVQWILYNTMTPDWPKIIYLALVTASVSWFCFLFMIRLVMHMWSHRSILPSLNGLNAMDVLVITNGILMIVPTNRYEPIVIFSSLQFTSQENFESGSLAQTSVIVLLPLGTLVAQRLANPNFFTTTASSSSSKSRSGLGNSAATSTIGSTTVSTINSTRPLLISHANDATFTAGVTTYVVSEPANNNGNAISSSSSNNSRNNEKVHVDHVDRELARIDSTDLERGGGGGGVRVDTRMEQSEVMVPQGYTDQKI
ncbi:fungal pheromone mating factor STE2 GPCR-domain-containing protein [Bombardia bombarda]|uniref:Fungal pheromone mating factor STE2 GPCR-domain-containing protein n=1 Tax=Bombardia bombarda TaxID=252184 RepID=A0AA40BVJ7_9PEZI|nr:fungal pheromone mating factor STE2 GPCR-domain-containing protein [Bombardia bombarda]